MNQDHGGIEACLDAGLPPTAALLEGNDPGAFLEEMTASAEVVGIVHAFRFVDGNGAELIGPALNGVPAGLHPTVSATPTDVPRDCDATEPTGGRPTTSTTDPPVGAASRTADEQVVRFTTGPARPGGPS